MRDCDLVHPVRQPALLGQGGLQRADLRACLLDLLAAGAPGPPGAPARSRAHAVHGGRARPRAPGAAARARPGPARPRGAAARPPRAPGSRRVRGSAPAPRAGPRAEPRISSSARRASARPDVEPGARLLQLDQACARRRRFGPRAPRPARGPQPARRWFCSRARSMTSERPERAIDGLGDLSVGRGRVHGGGSPPRALGSGEAHRRSPGRPRSCRRSARPPPGAPVPTRRRGWTSTTVWWLCCGLGERIAARGGDLERLEEPVELEALAHAHGHERQRHLELVAVLAPRGRLDLAATLRAAGCRAARVSTSGRPSMRGEGQPNSCSAGRPQRVTEPSRSVRTKRASTSWRSSSSTTSAAEAPVVTASSYIRPLLGRRTPSRRTTGRPPGSDMC